jgi:hypothetical protein
MPAWRVVGQLYLFLCNPQLSHFTDWVILYEFFKNIHKSRIHVPEFCCFTFKKKVVSHFLQTAERQDQDRSNEFIFHVVIIFASTKRNGGNYLLLLLTNQVTKNKEQSCRRSRMDFSSVGLIKNSFVSPVFFVPTSLIMRP